MSKLSRVADRFRRDMLKREQETGSILLQRYGETYVRLVRELDGVTSQIVSLLREEKEVSRNLLFRRTRLQNLLNQVDSELEMYAEFANEQTTRAQAQAVVLAEEHSRALVAIAPGPLPQGLTIPQNFVRFNPSVVQEFIGRASNGSPLAKLFEELSTDPTVSPRKAIEEVFVKGIVSGDNPRVIARKLKTEFQVPAKRALTIARTEVLGVYRETNRQFYMQNPDVVLKWRWLAAKNGRTCGMCLAMDGRVFPRDYVFGTHPNCRCTQVPVTPTWAELGFPEIPDVSENIPERGELWFDRQSDEFKQQTLGPGKFERYKEGKLTLQDLIGYRVDREWGPNRWERSMKAIDAGKNKPRKKDRGILPQEKAV